MVGVPALLPQKPFAGMRKVSLYSWKYEQQYSGHGKTQAKAFPERATHTALVCASCCTLAGIDRERGFLPCPQPSVSTASL